jgi:hypothetical protein
MKTDVELDEKTKEVLKNLSTATNRSIGQTKELYALCGKDLQKLVKVEERLRNHSLSYCPGDVAEVNNVLAMRSRTDHFDLREFYSVPRRVCTFLKSMKRKVVAKPAHIVTDVYTFAHRD